MENNRFLELEDFRIALQKLDAQLIRILTERQRIASEIGAIKRRQGTPIEQPEIWDRQCEERRAQAIALGVHPELVEQVFASIHKFSKDIQQQHATTNE